MSEEQKQAASLAQPAPAALLGDEREAFEVIWMQGHEGAIPGCIALERLSDGNYDDLETQDIWEAWQLACKWQRDAARQHQSGETQASGQAPAASAGPLFWYRPRSDGGYEGPIHNAAIERVRKESGAWVPLVPGAAPVAAQAPQAEQTDFSAWLAREMPAGTIIGDPAWWAPRILRAAGQQPAIPAPTVEALRRERNAWIDAGYMGTIPAGFWLAPEKLTESMHAAGGRAIARSYGNDDWPHNVYAAWRAAAPQAPQPQAMPDDFLPSIKHLCVAARTTGGIAGRDDGLCTALDRVEAMLEAVSDPDWRAQASQRSAQAPAVPLELAGVAETLAEGSGFWRSCSGCHELSEGRDTGPYSGTMKCHLGGGCSECGGIGAIWDTTDYQAMADDMARSMGQNVAAPAVPEGLTEETFCDLQAAADVLNAIADRQRQTADVIEPISDIRQASRLARGARERLNRAILALTPAFDAALAAAPQAPTPPASALGERYAALEEAARICDGQAKEPECPERAIYCAAAIRALKSLPPASAAPAAQVAYLDIGAGGYVDIGTDLTDEQMSRLPKGRHMLAIIGTHGVDGYTPAAPAPQCSECKGTGTSEGRDGALVPCLACSAAPAPAAQASEHDIIAAFSVAGLSCDDKQMDNRKYSVRGQLAQLVNGARALLSRYGAASHEFDANDMQAQWNAGFSVGSAAPRPTDDEMWDQALRERDSYHDMADQLAAQIAAITGEEIGEHSSANDPWRNAMLAADEFIAAQIRKLCSAPAVQTAPLAEEDARPTGTLVGLGGGWIINPDAAQAAPLAAPTRPHQTTAHPIKEPYTLAEIEARIASHDYSAELLLLHAMELLRGRPGEDARPVAWEVTNDSFSFWTAVRKESRARDIADEQQRAGWPGAEVRPLVYATPQPSAQAAPAVPLLARALAEWHEDDGPVMWWAWNGHEWAGEPAWCGQPDDSDWPGYHTHWTPHPAMPAALTTQGASDGD